MRLITDHIINPANDKLVIEAVDEPGAGGAHHRYEISGLAVHRNPSLSMTEEETTPNDKVVILFQNGAISEHGVNGVTIEAFIALGIDRLRMFQQGPYHCNANACALQHLQEALMWLQQRTIERMRRGVEGTSKV
jgi:hypothetical protein